MKDIAIYGAGGLGRETACLVRQINAASAEPRWRLIGFFDDAVEPGARLQYGPCLGGLDALNAWDTPLDVAMAIASPAVLRRLTSAVTNRQVDFPNIIAPTVLMLDEGSLGMGRGNIIANRCLLSCNVRLGDFNILDGSVTLGHEAAMGSHNVVMRSVNICGGVTMGDDNFLGIGSIVLQYLTVGSRVSLSRTSVLASDAAEPGLYVGNPARMCDK